MHGPPVPPPLESGDRLSRDEFERRYASTTSLKKAELVEGVVFMPASVRWRRHAQPHGRLITWLGVYQANTPGTMMGGNGTARLDLENEPQPDAMLLIDPDCGGQAGIDEEDYVVNAPEFAGEVSASSASIDLHLKRRVYLRNGICEYLVWRVYDEAIDWFVLRSGEYETIPPNDQGWLCSEQFPGLWLDAQAMVGGDMARVLTLLQRGLNSSEHAEFVKRLAEKTE